MAEKHAYPQTKTRIFEDFKVSVMVSNDQTETCSGKSVLFLSTKRANSFLLQVFR